MYCRQGIFDEILNFGPGDSCCDRDSCGHFRGKVKPGKASKGQNLAQNRVGPTQIP